MTTTSQAVNEVRIVRLRVWLTASLMIWLVRCGVFPFSSRIRSKMTIVSLTEKPISVRNAAIIGRSILNGSRSRAWLTPGIMREPVGDRHGAQGDEHVVDDRDDRRQAVDQRLEPEPEVEGDDQPARDGGDDGQAPGLAGHGAAEGLGPLEEEVPVVLERRRPAWRARPWRRRARGWSGGSARSSRPPWSRPGVGLRVEDLEAGVGVVDPRLAGGRCGASWRSCAADWGRLNVSSYSRPPAKRSRVAGSSLAFSLASALAGVGRRRGGGDRGGRADLELDASGGPCRTSRGRPS